MNIPKRKLPVLCVVFYVLAAILALYAVWALVNCHEYIVKLVAGKQLVTNGNEYSIVSYYMTNCVQYVLYAAAFLFFGRIYQYTIGSRQLITPPTPPCEEQDSTPSTIFPPDDNEETNDKEDDFSDWNTTEK